VRELPPICGNVRQRQRLSIDTLPPEVKAPFPSDPVIPLRTKTTKEFQEDVDRAVQSGDWREVREFYLTTFDSFIEINAAFKREANGLFNTIEDSGVNAKFVSVVYDSLLSTVSETKPSSHLQNPETPVIRVLEVWAQDIIYVICPCSRINLRLFSFHDSS
ncbi:hypothetical protein XENOCAPTIV_023574, partial [Xenoophorus captivus]